jgi:hypothetical protein
MMSVAACEVPAADYPDGTGHRRVRLSRRARPIQPVRLTWLLPLRRPRRLARRRPRLVWCRPRRLHRPGVLRRPRRLRPYRRRRIQRQLPGPSRRASRDSTPRPTRIPRLEWFRPTGHGLIRVATAGRGCAPSSRDLHGQQRFGPRRSGPIAHGPRGIAQRVHGPSVQRPHGRTTVGPTRRPGGGVSPRRRPGAAVGLKRRLHRSGAPRSTFRVRRNRRGLRRSGRRRRWPRRGQLGRRNGTVRIGRHLIPAAPIRRLARLQMPGRLRSAHNGRG